MTQDRTAIDQLILSLFDIGCVKFGEFKLKSGITSPIYFDLRILPSYPDLLRTTGKLFAKKITESAIEFDVICGVPYGAISLATVVAMELNRRLIFKRKEAKEHGTGQMVEGKYNPGTDKCLIIDDVITSGISVIETIEGLKKSELESQDAVVLLDREQGGAENVLQSKNVNVHSIFKTKHVLHVLLTNKQIGQDVYNKTLEFLEANKQVSTEKKRQQSPMKELTFDARAKLCKNKVSKQLFEIMSLKQSNLCFSADFTSFAELLKAAEELGPHICMLKTHVDILDDFSADKMQQLSELALRHNFLLFEDRKFADIGNTVRSQYSRGLFKISQWANIVNAHALTGPSCINGLKDALEDHTNRACLLIGQLSSKDNLIDESYTKKTIQLAESNNDFVIGFICQKKLSTDPTLLHIAPGVKLNLENDLTRMSDNLGQQYITPQVSLAENKCDIIVVGRGIMAESNSKEAAIKYQQAAFNAYLQRVEELIN